MRRAVEGGSDDFA